MTIVIDMRNSVAVTRTTLDSRILFGCVQYRKALAGVTIEHFYAVLAIGDCTTVNLSIASCSCPQELPVEVSMECSKATPNPSHNRTPPAQLVTRGR